MMLAGCRAHVVKKVTLPTGENGFYVTCHGTAHDWTECYENARKACNGDYTIADKSETSTPTRYGPIVKRSLMIDCKK